MIVTLFAAAVLGAASSSDPRVIAAEAALREAVADTNASVTTQVIAAPTAVDGEIAHVTVGAMPPGLPRARVGVPVQWRDADGTPAKGVVWFGLSVVRDMPVWGRSAGRGESASPIGIRTAAVDVARVSAAPLPDGGLEGWRLARTVHEGEPLRAGDLERKPAVERERTLTLRVSQPGIRIETPVVAQQDGDVGDWIHVKALGTGEPVRARVMSSSEVELAR